MPVAEGPVVVTPETHNRFRHESNRLKTYRSWPEATRVPAERLARAGFYYVGNRSSVQCFECGGRINEWSPNDIAISKHRQFFPECKFVTGNSDNIPLVDSLPVNTHQPNRHLLMSSSDPSPSISPNSYDSSLSTSPTIMTSSSLPNGELIESGEQLETLLRNSRNRDLNMSSFYQLMKNERNRLKSFYIRDYSIWSLPFIRPEDLAKAGFFFINDDKVQCAFCRGEISNWSPGDRPLSEHSRHYPRCPFIMEEDVGNIPIGNDPIRSALPVLGHDVCGNRDPFEHMANSLGNTRNSSEPHDMRQMGIQPYSGPKQPNMGQLEARLRTFANTGWDRSIPVSPEKLAQAGFYYIGIDDAVKCFHCDGGLLDWSPGDDPWIEHAKKFPYCNFLKLNRSESFINECRRLEQRGSQTSDENENSTSDDIIACRVVEEWMSSDIVQQLLSCHYSRDLIKAILNNRYYSCKKPFESFAELYEAVKEADNRSNDNHITINQTIPTESNLPINASTSMSSTSIPPQQSIPTNGTETNKEIQIQKPNDGNESRLLCKICYLNEIGVVFLPCGHQLACNECALRLTDCPVCRKKICGFVRTYFS